LGATVFEFFGDLSSSLLFVFCMLRGVLIPEFGDLILRVWGQRKIEQQERFQSSETPGGTASQCFREAYDTVLIESRGTVAC
jgi:hypothetical protein